MDSTDLTFSDFFQTRATEDREGQYLALVQALEQEGKPRGPVLFHLLLVAIDLAWEPGPEHLPAVLDRMEARYADVRPFISADRTPQDNVISKATITVDTFVRDEHGLDVDARYLALAKALEREGHALDRIVLAMTEVALQLALKLEPEYALSCREKIDELFSRTRETYNTWKKNTDAVNAEIDQLLDEFERRDAEHCAVSNA